MYRFVWKIVTIIILVVILLPQVTVWAESDQPQIDILRITSEGQKVVDLQMRLRDLGYFNYKVTGYFGPATAAAVKNFQERNHLMADGIAGEQTLDVLYSCDAIREAITSGQSSGLLPVSRGGRTTLGSMVNWFQTGQYLYPRNSTAKVTDLYTGISFYMIRTGGNNHADVEPVSREDTNKIRQIWGGWSWERRPVIVEVGGERIAASMHGMPHAYNRITNNGMQGHVCIHFFKSRTHINNREDSDHQAMVRKAAGR